MEINNPAGCVWILFFWGSLFGGSYIGAQMGVPWLGFALAIGSIFVFLPLIKEADRERDRARAEEQRARAEQEKERLRQQKAEEERRWNSPEEIERRRLEKEEQERRLKEQAERLARDKWALYHRYRTIEQVDGMSGREFEWFMKTLFERRCYEHVQVTPASGDQGGDLTCVSPEGKKAVVQAKRWKGKVGIGAIQEVRLAMDIYHAEIAFVTTNSHFTEQAKAAAKNVSRLTLVDREVLQQWIEKVFPPDVPDFEWDKYNQYVRDWQPPPPAPIPGKNVSRTGVRSSYGRKRRRKPRGDYRRRWR